MGEWLSNNVLLPVMYFLIDMGVAFAVLLLAMHLLEKIVNSFKPDFVFHLAAQPLVRQSYLNPTMTYQTNVIGTLNLLE